jgi:glucokinase
MRAAFFPSEDLNPLKLKKISTQHPKESAWDRLIQLIDSIWPEQEEVIRIGVAVPGPFDPFQGVILSAPNIPAWKNLPVSRLLQEKFGVPIDVGNDANLAAMGEWRFGAGKGHRHLVYVTVSTGIGGGVIVDNRLLLGDRGLAGELGHVTVARDGPLCGCGQRGHLEAMASGPAIARWVKEEISRGAASSLSGSELITTQMIADAARSGDELALRALERAGTSIGVALADILHIFNPTIVIVGGGVSLSGELIMRPIRSAMQAHVMNTHFLDNLTLTTASLGDETGLLGALALARHQANG